ncbi:MAG TPA: penicillin-binding protein 2 [Acidimicrobiales bacterium]|nr:penicillin-binding protein 2 [Acidimicrobiales bacterium]
MLLFAIVVGRMAQLQLFDRQRYTALGASQRVRPVVLPAERGSLFDRNGADLALSVPQHTVWADPRLVSDPQREADALAPVLSVDRDVLLRALTTPNKQFVYLARQVDDTTTQKVKDLKLDGVELLDESKRFNPSGDLARSVLGSVNIDNVGRAGLEQQYDGTMTGTPGQLVLEQDPNGRTIAEGEHHLTPAQPGDDLVLTVDTAMQFETERALSDQIVKMGAKGGMAIVSNPKTGEILAIANMDRPNGTGTPVASTNNRALTTVFEPGSASKVITMAAALEEGVVPPDATLTVPDHLKVADATFTDHDPHPTETMSLTDILANSSNIGTIMLGQKLGAERIDSYQRKFGFGQTTALNFPNESAGLMLPLKSWSGTSIGTIPIGQGVAVTATQMLDAFNVIANGGVYVDPKLVLATVGKDGTRHPTPPSSSHRVVSTQTAAEVRDMMEQVVISGTGTQAAIDGYTVAGKTGTARKPQPNGGYQDAAGNYHYVTTFAGFVPAEDPQLSAIVVLDEPTATIFASGASAPVFSRIASYALRRFHIPPPGITLAPTVPAPTHPNPAGATQANDVTGTVPPTTSTTVPPKSTTTSTTTPPKSKKKPGG